MAALPGPTGGAAEELRLWPPWFVDALGDLLLAVERFGKWPGGLRAADVVLLPKPGGALDEPLQRTALSHLMSKMPLPQELQLFMG